MRVFIYNLTTNQIYMKKYLKVTVTFKDGNQINNPLMMSESRLIGKFFTDLDAKEIHVRLIECDLDHYNFTFGKSLTK